MVNSRITVCTNPSEDELHLLLLNLDLPITSNNITLFEDSTHQFPESVDISNNQIGRAHV